MDSGNAFLNRFSIGVGILFVFVTILRIYQGDPNAGAIIVPALFAFIAAWFFQKQEPWVANWSLILSALIGWAMFLMTPFFSEPLGNIIMKFLLICLFPTLALILSGKINRLILIPPPGTQVPAATSRPVVEDVSARGDGIVEWLRYYSPIIGIIISIASFLVGNRIV